jgi:DNA mismatch repair protein MutS
MDEGVLGPPEELATEEELTPLISQYVELCERYDDSLVLIHVGDFYKAFCEAAEMVARRCELTVVQREDSTGEYPMAGIPVDNAESYVETLLEAGYRVAVAEQVEDPDEATGVVDRAVTRVLTPGTLTEDELLVTDDNTYVACVADGADGEYALAAVDVSTGEFFVTDGDRETVADEVDRFDPAEAIVSPGVSAALLPGNCMVTPFERPAFDPERARETAESYFPEAAALESTAAVRATGALLAYAEYARGGEDGEGLSYFTRLVHYDPASFMRLDAVALRSLEVFDRRTVDGEADDTLVGVLDRTNSALGSRKLKQWLRRPLLEETAIAARHDAVEELAGSVRTRERLADLLADVYDIERLVTRVSRTRANARDLRSLKQTLDVVPALREALADADCETLRELRDDLDDVPAVRELVGRAIRDDPPPTITEGSVISEGYDEELDELRATERAGREWVADLEAAERERTGIDSLKVGYNEVHGYYIEVTNPNLDAVPEDYRRRQTLKNAERFYTPELKEREEEILRAESRADTLEHRLFTDVRDRVADETERVQAVAEALAELDVYVGLADVAVERDYCRPTVGADGIRVERGRHPVVECTEDEFVPNDTSLDAGDVAVVTGPNMSGKSTYMRQVALIAVLAQTGSFVPAASARLPLVDRVFTRVGASDDIAGGQSTFMREMSELTEILRRATADSLVLLDEVGRGTSTADGLAIARAVTEYVHDEVGATTLFATHYHDLTAVATQRERVRNRHFEATTRADGSVAFDHEIRTGASDASYGIEVAEMAGVPEPVVERSRELAGDGPGSRGNGTGPAARTTARDGGAHPVIEQLRSVDVAETTPLEAIELLWELRRQVD